MDTPLFHSLQALCKRQMDNDVSFKQEHGEIYNAIASKTSADADAFNAYRLHKLKRTLALAETKSPFYRKLFARFDVRADDVSGLADLSRFPLTSPEDLAANPYAMLCTSQSRVERAISFISSGTTGPSKRVFFLPEEIEHMTDFMAAGLATVADESDVIQILLPEGPAMGQCDLLARGASKLGATPVLSGMFAPPEEQIACIRKNGSTVLFAETHLLYRITKAMEDSVDLSSLGVHTLFVTTSHAASAVTRHLAETWNARVTSHYGLTEMGLGLAVDCPICKGRHMDELNVLAEVINPETGETLPLGSEGELVFTTLQREGMPLIRYRTRDIATLKRANPDCPCNHMLVLGEVEHRNNNGVVACGTTIYPTTFHETLFSLEPVIDYCVSVEADEASHDRLFFEVETKRQTAAEKRLVEDAIAASFETLRPQTDTPFRLALIPLGSLQQGRHFKKIVTDLREANATDRPA